MRFKLTALMGIFIIALVFNTSFFVEPVSGSEEEEFDGFNQMPNYRYENQTTTSGVQEQLIGDQYETYAFNNETSGTSNLEKSRKLNSRDFHFDSRFAVDIGGNQTEYARDTLGNAWDFNEGDEENWTAISAAILNIGSGQLQVSRNPVDSTWGMQFSFTDNISSDVYHTFKFRLRATGIQQSNLRVKFEQDGGTFKQITVVAGNIPIIWTDYEIELTQFNEWEGKITLFQILAGTTGAGAFVIDSIELIGDLDFATAVEGEIEDTWDWEDSVDYWFDVEGNTSDFEEDLDGWTNDGANYSVIRDGGRLKGTNAPSGGVTDDVRVKADSLTIASATYHWFTMEFESTTDNITNIEIRDAGSNIVISDSTGWIKDQNHLLSHDLSLDANWTGTETEVKLWFTFDAADTQFIFVNFTFLYDVELGDREGFVGYTTDTNAYTYVHPEGYLVARKRQATIGWGAVRVSGHSIPSDNFDTLVFRMRSSIATTIGVFDQQLNKFEDISLTTSFQIFTIDLSLESEWTGTENGFVWRDAGNSANNHYFMDYVLLLGHWSETDGYKFSLLNQDSDEGMYFQFTNSGSEPGNYTIHIDMLDISGITLSHETDFQYDFATDGFLRLDVDWHLEKKEMKINLFYENGSTIIKTRDITDIYPNLGFGQLILLKSGFPQLCINNSVGPIARSLVIIDYIDADWLLTNWLNTFSTGSGVTDFSPYSYRVYHAQSNLHAVTFSLDVDRFDGVSFEMEIDTESLDNVDFATMTFSFFTVYKNGSIEELFRIRFHVGSLNTEYQIFNRGVLVGNNTEVANDVIAKVSVYRENNERFDLQFRHDGLDDNIHNTALNTTEAFSQEVLMRIAYSSDTAFAGFADDEISMQMTGFDLIRKDFLIDLPGLILDPVGALLGFVGSLFVGLFTWLGGLFGGIFQAIIDIIEPLLTDISNFLSTISDNIANMATDLGNLLAAITVGIQNALDALVIDIALILVDIGLLVTDIGTIITSLAGLAAGIWTAFVAGITAIVVALLGALFVALETIWNIIVGIVFFVWDALGLPDLLAIADLLLTGFIQLVTDGLGALEWLIDVINVWKNGVFFLGTILLLAIPAFMSKGPGEFMDNFTRWNSWNILPIRVLGFAVHIPVGIVFWPLEFLVLFEMAG